MPSYDRIAALCPALQVPTTVINPAVDTPPLAIRFTPGDTVISPQFNNVANRTRILARHGGGGYAVISGLDLSADALILTVSAGQAMLDDPETLAADTTTGLTAGMDNFIWLGSGTTLTAVVGSMTAPIGAQVYLGCVFPDAGAGIIDYSGRFTNRNNQLWRRTADLGEPTDSPAATASFWTRVADGVYLWDGSAYICVDAMDLFESADLRLEVLEEDLWELKGVVGRMLVQDVERFGELRNPELEDPFSRAAADPYLVV